MLKRGHRIIGLINGPTSLIASGQRQDGYINALQSAGLNFDTSLALHCDLTQKATEDMLAILLARKQRPTAIVLFNDYVCAFAIKYAIKLGIKINEEIEFVSFANAPITSYMAFPPLASLEQFPAKQATKATEILLDLIENQATASKLNSHLIIEPKLIVANH